MRAVELDAKNVGAACKLYRMRYTSMSQLDFAEKYQLSVSNLCGFENGYVMSMKCFLAFIHDGFLGCLLDISERDVGDEVRYQFAVREYKETRKEKNAGG